MEGRQRPDPVFSRSVGCSWRVDETYIAIKGNWHYLYRAVDKHGRTVDFLLRPDRGIAAAQAFFRKALASHTDHPPLKIKLDGHWHSHRALRLLRREQSAWRRVRVRSSTYLNKIVEQDHRAVKQRCGPMRGFKSFANAAITIAGSSLHIESTNTNSLSDEVGLAQAPRCEQSGTKR